MNSVNHLKGQSLYAAAMISAAALQTWVSLYFAVTVCALICASLAAIVTTAEIYKGTWRPSLVTKADIALALPRLWLHWQIRYFSGAPVILVIAFLYAQHLGFAKLAAL